MKNTFSNGMLLLALFILVVIASCKKEGDIPTLTVENDDTTLIVKIDYGEMTDIRDGKTYKTIIIGNQDWMAENLAYAPSNGNFWMYDDDSANLKIYGYLYELETVLNVCPEGWHLPSRAEWDTLTSFLGDSSLVGGKMKSTSDLWYSPNTAATNSSGFSGLPGGFRQGNMYYVIGVYGVWWTSIYNYNGLEIATVRDVYSAHGYLGMISRTRENAQSLAHSCRCLKD